MAIIAVIDLGSASLRFEVYSVVPSLSAANARYSTERLYRFSEMMGMSEQVWRSGRLDAEAKIACLRIFSELRAKLYQMRPQHIAAVATSLFREAKDGEQFIIQLEEAVGYGIRIISGEEEAQLIARGILANEIELPQEFAAVDIGGGSTEVSICSNGQVVYARSLPLGAIRANCRYLQSEASENISSFWESKAESNIDLMRNEIRNLLLQAGFLPYQSKIKQMLGSSSNVRSSIRAAGHCGRNGQEELFFNELPAFTQRLMSMSLAKVSKLPGVEAKRAGLVLPSAIILQEVMKFFGAQQICPTLFSLRHGLLDQAVEIVLGDG